MFTWFSDCPNQDYLSHYTELTCINFSFPLKVLWDFWSILLKNRKIINIIAYYKDFVWNDDSENHHQFYNHNHLYLFLKFNNIFSFKSRENEKPRWKMLTDRLTSSSNTFCGDLNSWGIYRLSFLHVLLGFDCI